MKNKYEKAFSLLEILITLSIIGIVASIILPNVIENHRQQVAVNKVKKAYNTINQAYQRAYIDIGEIPEEMYVGKSSDRKPQVFYEQYIKPYYKIIKYCPPGDLCGYTDKSPIYQVNNKKSTFRFQGNANFTIVGTNGITYLIQPFADKVLIHIDLNGYKSPNKYGKDIFDVIYNSQKGFLPYMYDQSDSVINDECMTVGRACLEKFRRANWKIEENYPW